LALHSTKVPEYHQALQLPTSEENEEDDESIIKPIIMSLIGIALGIWLPNMIVELIFTNNCKLIGPMIKSSNLYLTKYYLDV
jgi:hypothetical protein